MSYPAPIGIILLATATWQKEEPKQQYFYGHSYTYPTPQEFAFQGIGLAISNAVDIQMQDAREGKLVGPSADDQDKLEACERLMASDMDEELLLPPPSTTVNLW